jgi:hypothetical protein
LDVNSNLLGNFHPRSGFILEPVDVEDLIKAHDTTYSLLFVLIAPFNGLDKSLKLVVVEELSYIPLDGIKN